MKKRQAVLIFSLLSILGICVCWKNPGIRQEMPEGKEREAAGSVFAREQEKVLILYDPSEEALGEIVEEIQKKIGGDACAIPSPPAPYTTEASRQNENKSLSYGPYELILVGGDGRGGYLSDAMSSFLDESDFEGKRLSPFWLAEGIEEEDEKAGENYADQFGQMAGNALLLPGMGFCWQEQAREDELSRMDGWLTTALTLKP